MIADGFEPVARYLPFPLNLAFIERLKRTRGAKRTAIHLKDEDVSQIVEDFEALTEELGIPLLKFWEMKPWTLLGFNIIPVSVFLWYWFEYGFDKI